MSEPKVNETKPSEIKPKKTVRRSSFIALGIIYIVLVACLVGGFGYFMLAIDDKDNTISSLNTQIYQLYSNVTNLRDQVYDLNDTLKLNKIDPWTHGWTDVNQVAGSYSSWNFSVPYAGAIYVSIQPQEKNSVYIRVLWNNSLLGIQYDYQTYGTWENGMQHASFPVLPTSSVEIRVGNTVPSGKVFFILLMEYVY